MNNYRHSSRHNNVKIRKIDTDPIDSLSSLIPNFPALYENQKVLLPEILKSQQLISGNQSKFLDNLEQS